MYEDSCSFNDLSFFFCFCIFSFCFTRINTTALHDLLKIDPCVEEERVKLNNSAVREALRVNPDVAKDRYDFTVLNYTYNLHPLSMAIAIGAPLDVVELLYDAFPEAVEDKTPTGETGLHFACWFHAPVDVVRFLAKAHPMAMKSKNQLGWTPLHLACVFQSPLEVVRILAEGYPDAMEEKSESGSTPFMLAKNNSASSEVQALLETLHTILCLNASNDEVYKILREKEGRRWRSHAAPVVDNRPTVLHSVYLDHLMLPTLFQKLGEECRLDTILCLVREAPHLLRGAVSNGTGSNIALDC